MGEVRAENPVETFRQTAGPWDVDMARELAPNSIRGAFGQDNSKNAVHCTDLPNDAFDEVNYFFGNSGNPAMIKPLSSAMRAASLEERIAEVGIGQFVPL